MDYLFNNRDWQIFRLRLEANRLQEELDRVRQIQAGYYLVLFLLPLLACAGLKYLLHYWTGQMLFSVLGDLLLLLTLLLANYLIPIGPEMNNWSLVLTGGDLFLLFGLVLSPFHYYRDGRVWYGFPALLSGTLFFLAHYCWLRTREKQLLRKLNLLPNRIEAR